MNNNCIVIGSGPAGVACAATLLEAGLPVTLVDGGVNLESDKFHAVQNLQRQTYERWDPALIATFKDKVETDSSGVQVKYLYGSDFPYREVDQISPPKKINLGHLTPTFATGGFSNVWGSAILPYTEKDIESWPIKIKDLAPFYRSAIKLMDVSAKNDDLESLFPLYTDQNQHLQPSSQAQSILKGLERNKRRLNGKNIFFGSSRLAVRASEGKITKQKELERNSYSTGCVYCGLCLYGCPYELIYNSRHTLESLKKTYGLEYIPNFIVRNVIEQDNLVSLYGNSRTSNEPLKLEGQKVFLAAGVLSSTQILLESLGAFDKALDMKVSEYFLLPLLRLHNTPNVTIERLHTLAQVFLECANPSISEKLIHMQLYTYSDLYSKGIRSTLRRFGPLSKWIEPLILGRLCAIQGYLHSDVSSRISLQLKCQNSPQLQLIGKINPASSNIIKRLSRMLAVEFLRARTLVLQPMLKIGKPGEGRHAGGTFPMSATPTGFQSDQWGTPVGFANVHVVDASVFPSIPAPTITLTAMANSQRIASHVAEQFRN